jgi:tetratricopeptide (TPR) repeat protein
MMVLWKESTKLRSVHKGRLFILLLLYLPSSVSFAQDLPDLLEKINPEIVTVVAYDSLLEPIGQGTGFFVDANCMITCWHVIEDAVVISIFTEDSNVTVVDSLGSIDWEADLVEMWVEPEEGKFRGLALASGLPRQGESIVVVGSPLGFERSISDGLVASIRTIPDFGQIIQITAPISEGSSGSPVINKRGEVIGVASFTLIDGQNVNFAIPTERIANIQQNYSDQMSRLLEITMSEATTRKSQVEEAEQLMEEGNYAEALKVWEAILSDSEEYYYGTFIYGLCLLNSGNYRAAITQFNKANELVETSAAYYNKYLSFLYLGDTSRATREIERALELDPTDSTYQLVTAKLRYRVGDYSRAISLLGQYLEQYPNDTYALLLFCYSLYYSNQDEQVSKCFARYLSLEPEDVDAREEYAWSLSAEGKHREALIQFEKCSQVRRGEYLHYWGMAESQLRLEDTASALKSYSIAIALDSTVAALHNDYGVLLFQTGKHSNALLQYEKANRIAPAEWMYLWNLGNTYLYLGYDDKGSEVLRKAKLLKEAGKSRGEQE